MDAGLVASAVGAFVTLFVLIDPIGLTPLFLALTAGASPRERRAIALRALAVAAGILALFGLAGEILLQSIGVGLPAFRISGGLMLFLIALEMLFEKRNERRGRTAAGEGAADGAKSQEDHDAAPPPLDRDPSVFPLATPLIAGPGAMASMILLTAKAETGVEEALVYLCALGVLGVCLALFMAAHWIERLLGPTGVTLVTRLFGVLLGALAVQFVLDGLSDYGMAVRPA
ncbi:MAG: MarC family protein [Pseudomonadota bacterium]